MQKKFFISILLIYISLDLVGCSSARILFGMKNPDRVMPIANPFYTYRGSDSGQTIILRTKKGDRSVELEIPGDKEHLSDFSIPVSPSFHESNRTIASQNSEIDSNLAVDESLKNKNFSLSDQEITRSFSQSSSEITQQRNDIEKNLNLIPPEESTNSEKSSYLAKLDHIKQLYKAARYEAALLEIDEMIREYQTDGKLYEMRGTLLDRMGRRELALKSWNQALRFSPNNEALKKFVNRIQIPPKTHPL